MIAPTAFVAGFLVLRRAAPGYLLAFVVLILGAVLGVGVVFLSAAQVWAGVFTTAETVVFVMPFVILTLLSLWCTALLFRSLTESTITPAGRLRAAYVSSGVAGSR